MYRRGFQRLSHQNQGDVTMTNRNFEKELNYYIYNDPEYSEDIEHICYPSLICIITELCDRIEQLERKLEQQEEYAMEQNEQ
jgi:hypothetical protein